MASSTTSSPSTSTSESPFLRRAVAGVECILAPRAGSGLVAARMLVRRGSADELVAEGEAGVSSFTASMLRRGTLSRSSEQIARELESLGAITGFDGGADHAAAAVRAAAPDFGDALDVLMECLLAPSFDAAELERERQSQIAALRRAEDDRFSFAFRRYAKRVFAGHGYGHPSEGEIEDVERVDPARCRAWHAKAVRPDRMLFVAAGDFEPDALCDRLERSLETHADSPRPDGGAADFPDFPRASRETPPAEAREDVELEKEGEQGFVVAGFRTPRATHPDFPALRIACAALGEGFGGRLFTNLRDRRSLAYAVGSFLASYRLGGHMALYIGTKGESVDEAREGLLSEAAAIAGGDLPLADFERARNYVLGKYHVGRQSLASRAASLAAWDDLGAGAEYDEEYPRALARVTPEQVVEAAARWWRRPVTVSLRPTAKPGASA